MPSRLAQPSSRSKRRDALATVAVVAVFLSGAALVSARDAGSGDAALPPVQITIESSIDVGASLGGR